MEGVTAGIDFALALAAESSGPKMAQMIQLIIEYSPAPPFDSGLPSVADARLVEKVRTARDALQHSRGPSRPSAWPRGTAADIRPILCHLWAIKHIDPTTSSKPWLLGFAVPNAPLVSGAGLTHAETECLKPYSPMQDLKQYSWPRGPSDPSVAHVLL